MTDGAYRLVRPRRAARERPVLDAAQQVIADHDAGVLVVLAGPGTGKTTTLVEAVAARVERGTRIEHLLMLTFGRRAANELRDRVTARLGRTVREPVARTLHSYAFGVLRMAAVTDGLAAPRLLSGPEQDVLIRDLIAGDLDQGVDRWPSDLRPALRTRGFAGELRDLLLRAVERGLSGQQLSELGRARRRADWIAAGQFLVEYHGVLALGRPGAFDPAELIQQAIAAFRADPALLRAERERRRRIFVDEYQDTDPAQVELLQLIADGADELVVVGDPDQAIYGFRGTDAAAMREAVDRFAAPAVRVGTGASVETVALTTSRRAGATLLATSRRAALRLPGPVQHRQLEPLPGVGPGSVEVRVVRSATEEASFIATVLRRAHLEDDLRWSRMAVLVRSTAVTLPVLRRAFISAGVPVSVRGDDLPLPDQPAVAHLVTALRCVVDPGELSEDVAEQLLLGPIGRTDPMTIRRLRRELRRLSSAAGVPPSERPLSDVVGSLDALTTVPRRVGRPVQRAAGALAAGRAALASGGGAEDALWAIWSATGLAEVWERTSRAGGVAGAGADRDLDAVIELFAAAARYADRLPSAAPREFLEHLAAQQVPGEARGARAGAPEAVQILTAHASKGLEWDLVCVAGVQEGRWPDLRPRGSLLGSEVLVDDLAGRDASGLPSVAAQLSEERRLFYVAVTRARRRLLVTAVAGDDEQPSRFLDEIDPIEGDRPVQAPPRGADLTGLVAELRSVITSARQSDGARAAAATELARLAAAGVPGAHPDYWWGLAPVSDDAPLADPDRPVPVSPSRIQAFIRCELQSVLTDLGGSDRDQVSASLGTLLHEIAALAPPDATLDEFERLLDERWDSVDFGARWFAANERVRAREMLVRLRDWLAATRAELDLVGVELDFSVVAGDAQLRGRVDRLERDHAGRVVVVDLKTGRSKVPADELATHPQLGAYQLAVEHGGFEQAGVATAGGARLVQVGTTAKEVEQKQPPIGESEEPQWIEEQISVVAARLRGSQFTALVNSYCSHCAVASSCPLSGTGGQVTDG